MVLLFTIFFLFTITVKDSLSFVQKRLLGLSLFALALIVGFRSYDWPDTIVYIMSFEQSPSSIFNIPNGSGPLGYAERGYFYLGVLVKTFVDDSRFYLLAMGALSMFLLYKVITKYGVGAGILLCLAVYVARFILNRDFVQIRSSLAILMILYGLKYVQERKMVHYFILIALAYTIHHMSLIGLPFYFLNRVKVSRTVTIIAIIIAFIASQVMPDTISSYVDEYSDDLQYTTYVTSDYTEQALGLANPMIYFQIFILMLFTFMEESIKPLAPYYDLFRKGYLYSTLILILFCNYTALSGRTSTMFATLEIFLFPLILAGVKNKRGLLTMLVLVFGVSYYYFFSTKYNSAMSIILQYNATIIPIK